MCLNNRNQTERTIKINLSPYERTEYNTLEGKAQEFYREFRLVNLATMSKHFLALSQKLTPLRVVSSGGSYPIHTGKTKDGKEEQDYTADDIISGDAGGDNGKQNEKVTKKRDVVYSDFEFKSKFEALLKELQTIRDHEASCKYIAFFYMLSCVSIHS